MLSWLKPAVPWHNFGLPIRTKHSSSGRGVRGLDSPPGVPPDIKQFAEKLSTNMLEYERRLRFQSSQGQGLNTSASQVSITIRRYTTQKALSAAFGCLFLILAIATAATRGNIIPAIQCSVWAFVFLTNFVPYLISWSFLSRGLNQIAPYLIPIYNQTKAEMLEESPGFSSFAILSPSKMILTISFEYDIGMKDKYIDVEPSHQATVASTANNIHSSSTNISNTYNSNFNSGTNTVTRTSNNNLFSNKSNNTTNLETPLVNSPSAPPSDNYQDNYIIPVATLVDQSDAETLDSDAKNIEIDAKMK